MTATVPGPGDRLAARISKLPSRHDGEGQFTARLDFNREPNLKWKNVRDHVVVVTGGDVKRSPRVVKGSNSAWTLMITPDGDGTVGIAVPITGSCDNQADVGLDDGAQLADGAWRTVRGPDRNALTRPANTVRNIEAQPTIRPPLTLSSPGNLTFVNGFEINPVEFPAAQGGSGAYSYDIAGTLPSGLSFNSTTRTLSGTPDVSGFPVNERFPDSRIGYTVTDAGDAGLSGEAFFTISILQPTLPSPGALTFVKDVDIGTVTLPAVTAVEPNALDNHVTPTYGIGPTLPAGL